MSLYLDIDLDYFVSPHLRESVANHRPQANPGMRQVDPTVLFNILREKEIQLGDQRFIFTNHMQSHLRWWLARKPDNRVIHIDAHSDLYGHTQPNLSRLNMLGCQNYLWHSIREGLVSEIYWVFPDDIVNIQDPNIVYTMFSPEQIARVSAEDNILHVDLACILPDGTRKTVAYHILKTEALPVFKETAEIITVASSPEFYPPQFDSLIQQVGEILAFPTDVLDRIRTQHTEMKEL